MKDLAANCSRDMVVPEIQKTIDLGVTEDYINYTRFNFEPIPHQDDIDIAIERGSNYYPMNAPNISGQLAKTYDTLYSNKKTTQEEKAPSAVTEEKV